MSDILQSILAYARKGKSENPGQRLSPADKRPTLDNLGETVPARKAEAQRVLSPVMQVLSLLAPGKAAIDAATYSPSAEAAFVTPRAGANPKSLREFADATLEHLPNPSLSSLQDITYTSLHNLYGKSKEGRDILAAARPPNIPIRLTELDKETRGRVLISPDGRPSELQINAFPVGGTFTPFQTLQHEIQHVIDLTQGRAHGTNLKDADQFTQDLKIADTLSHTDESGKINKRTLDQIWEQSNVDTYLRETGENRARIDAGQSPQFEPFATWYLDPTTQQLKKGK